jgi:major type 1 subunit fimbrin (pilin)
MITMKKSVLTAFITVVCATSSVMAADDNAITDGSVMVKLLLQLVPW